MNVSVCIATYGNHEWEVMAEERAYPSAHAQDPFEVLMFHDPDGTIASVRNELGKTARGDWLCFLDADDELAPGYLEAMRRAVSEQEHPSPLLLTPAVSYVLRGHRSRPKFWKEVPLSVGNWLVIGTLIQRSLFTEIGGFRDFPVYEDYDLFARAVRAGAGIVKVPAALYLAHRSPGNRNLSLTKAERVRVHYDIGRDVFPDDYPESWLTQHLRYA